MINNEWLVKLVAEHIESLHCSLYGRAYDTGTEKARLECARDLVETLIEPIMQKVNAIAEVRFSTGIDRADPDTWEPEPLRRSVLMVGDALTRGNALDGLLGGSQGKSAPGTLGSESPNESLITPFRRATDPDLGQPSPHHSRETWQDYRRRTGQA